MDQKTITIQCGRTIRRFAIPAHDGDCYLRDHLPELVRPRDYDRRDQAILVNSSTGVRVTQWKFADFDEKVRYRVTFPPRRPGWRFQPLFPRHTRINLVLIHQQLKMYQIGTVIHQSEEQRRVVLHARRQQLPVVLKVFAKVLDARHELNMLQRVTHIPGVIQPLDVISFRCHKNADYRDRVSSH